MPINDVKSLFLFQIEHLHAISYLIIILPIIFVSVLFYNLDYLKTKGWKNPIGISTTVLFCYLLWYIIDFIRIPSGISIDIVKDYRNDLILIVIAVAHGIPSAAYGINRLIRLGKKG
jgi:hypothetical protein